MEAIIAQERAEEKKVCCHLQVHNARDVFEKAVQDRPLARVRREISVITRSGRNVAEDDGSAGGGGLPLKTPPPKSKHGGAGKGGLPPKMPPQKLKRSGSAGYSGLPHKTPPPKLKNRLGGPLHFSFVAPKSRPAPEVVVENEVVEEDEREEEYMPPLEPVDEDEVEDLGEGAQWASSHGG